MLSSFRKFSAIALIGLALFSAGSLWPAPAAAQMAVVSTTTADVPKQVESTLTKIKNAILNALKYSMTNAVLTASDTAAQRIAANAATYIVSGGKGKSPLAYITGWNNWHDNILMDGVSDALNTLSTKYLGFGLCAPLNLSIDLRIKLGVARLYAPKPSCTANAAFNAFNQTKSNIQSGQFLSGMKVSFEMGTSPMSVALNTQYSIVNKATNALTSAVNQRLTSPFKPLTDKISGNIKTPANMIADVAAKPQNEADKAAALKKQVAITNMDLWAAVGTNALKIFTSTLMSAAMDKYLKGGVLSGKDLLCDSSAGKSFDLCHGVVNETATAGTESGSTDAALAQAYFAALFTPPVATIDDYSPLGDLSSCPGQDARGIWNCAMDQGFVSALSAQDDGYLSVADAIKKPGMLNGSWQLIPPNDTRDSEYNCYSQGYCYSNLVKLRRMRIIPVGWEMAAKIAGSSTTPITLQGAIDAFNDKSSPYYHLIDPDWILKMPVTQCKAQVYGQTLEAANAGERGQVCVDAPSCIKEDGNGNCTDGFGYCTREHNVWQIDATSCPVQFASCDTFTDPNGKDLSVLKNTVDAGICDATNAGCRPFNLTADNVGNWADGQPSIYLNSQAPDCDAANAGCRALNEIKTANTANLIPNPSFETPTADGTMASGWHSLGGTYLRDGVSSFDGIAAFHIVSGGGLKLGGWNWGGALDADHYAEVQVQPKALYTVSFYAKGGASATGILEMKAFDAPFYGASHPCANGIPDPTCLQDMDGDIGYLPTCTTTATVGAVSCVLAINKDYGEVIPDSSFLFNFPLSAGYERETMTFATSSNTHYLAFQFGWGDFYIDAVQLETGATATAFHVGGSDSAGAEVDIKAPPAYLHCTGEPTDVAQCSAYAPVCRQSEVGCDDFTPSAGGTDITAVTSTNDACPAQCVGYSTFKQEPTLWNSAQFPLYFIPSTAKSCSMAQVGCDEFTDLAAAANGGESKAYYTYIRSCRAPDAGSDGNYFTWEGSDTSGYQLESYVLVNAVSGDGTMLAVPNTAANFVPTTGPNPQPNPPGPVYLTGTDPVDCTQDIYSGANGAVKNPDCRQFINAEGDIFYRLLSATITATADCKSYRKTLSTQADCQGSGGVWNAGASACDYFTYPAQSTTCPASISGCRAYTGNQGNNVRTIFTSDFENNDTGNWTGGASSSESTVVGEHSYAAATAQKPMADSNGSPLLTQGRAYTLTVWAKGAGNLDAHFTGKNITSDEAAARSNYFADPTKNPIALTTEWQRYELGPVIVDWVPAGTDSLALGVSSGTGYFDNVELDESQEEFALIADSWKTPAVCDETSAGQALPQAQLNCAEYASKAAGASVNLKSFDHLCRAEAVGCEAFTDTQGTDTPFSSFRNAVCKFTDGSTDSAKARDCQFDGQTVCSVAPSATSCRFDFDGDAKQFGSQGAYTTSVAADTMVIPPDSTDYLINDGKFACDATSVGCTPLGDNDLNTLDAQLDRVPWKVNGKTVYKTIVPDNLKNELCTQAAVSCTQWTTTSGDTTYFKDPGAATCEYKDSATYQKNAVSGWFKTGTPAPCDPTYIVGGNALGIRKNLDTQFGPDNFAGVCPSAQAGCTEFTDHADPGKVISPTTVGASCQYATTNSTCGSAWCSVDPTTGNVTNVKCQVEFPSGRPFYYINDSKITDATAACNSQVSQKKGCLLLDQTDNPQKTYDTVASYAASTAAGFALVTPINNAGDSTVTPAKPPTNDANIILQVKRDRVCSEWLECNTEQTVTDPATGRDATRCLSLGSCLEKGADNRCQTWGQLDTTSSQLTFGSPDSFYEARNVTSSGNDFSGFSIPDQYPVATYTQSDQAPYYKLNIGSASPVSQSCEAYPESDAPFPRSVLVDPTVDLAKPSAGASRITGYNNTNVCEGADCECSYRKAVFGAVGTRYYPTNAETGTQSDGMQGDIPEAICSGGKYDKSPCNPLAVGNRDESKDNLNLSCNDGQNTGECTAFTKIDSLLGQKGYCLERDNTLQINGTSGESACITWLPVDAVQGNDTANQFLTAAFIPKINQERYCSAPAKYCVPRDCANGQGAVPVCTLLQNVHISYDSGNSDYTFENVSNNNGIITNTNGCFQTCYPNNASCFAQEQGNCMGIIDQFCQTTSASIYKIDCIAMAQAVPGCQEQVPEVPATSTTPAVPASTKLSDDPYCMRLYDQCTNYKAEGETFCDYFEKTGPNGTSREGNYGHDQNYSTFAGGWCGGYNGGGPNNYIGGANYWKYGSDYDYHGHAINDMPAANYINYDPAHITAANGGAYTLADCSTAGTQLCNNDYDCASGTACVAVNDLSVAQTEYTEQETNEQLIYDVNGVPFTSASVFGSSWGSGVVGPSNAFSYSTIPGRKGVFGNFIVDGVTTGTHTYFGGAANNFRLPTLSTSALKFALSSDGATGDWLNVNSTSGCADSTGGTTGPCYVQNFNPDPASQANPTMRPYPGDFIGYYRYGLNSGSGSVTADYDLVEPKVLLTSQIDRVVIKILSNGNDGLCQYLSVWSNNNPVVGYCQKMIDHINPPLDKDRNTSSDYTYGYFVNGSFNVGDDENFSNTGISYLVLNAANNWSARAGSDEGDVEIKLRLSDNSPQRVQGITLNATDQSGRGYVYVQSLDVSLNGQMCGLATYVGSSNPFADPFVNPVENKDFAPVAYTNSVNAKVDYVKIGKQIPRSSTTSDSPKPNQKNQCTPWGAFTTSSPPGYVNEQTTAKANVCQINQGTVYSSQAAIQSLFVKGWSQPYDDVTYDFDDHNGSATPPFNVVPTMVPPPPAPTVDPAHITINNEPQYVYGSGSVRAALKFYASADPDHMPIRRVVINWDDSSSFVDPGNVNFYKNHLWQDPTSGAPDACDSSSFGKISPDTCTTDPFIFTHVYSCPKPIDDLLTSRAAGLAAAAGATMGCVYTPTITVTDNWDISSSNPASMPQVVVSP